MEYGVRGTGYGDTGGELGVHGVRGTGYSGRARRRWGTEYGVRRASWAYTEYGVWGTAAGVPREWGPNLGGPASRVLEPDVHAERFPRTAAALDSTPTLLGTH